MQEPDGDRAMNFFSAALSVLAIIYVWSASCAADVTVGMRVYSQMNYTPSEGEFYGLQVAIVPYSKGQKILWRSGSGRLDEPLLLDAVGNGDVLKVVVPEENDQFGEWTLSQDGKVIHARGPRDLHFDLREIPFR